MSAWLGWFRIFGDLVHFVGLCLRPKASLAAENLFLRKQLAFYQERNIKPRRADNLTRLTLVLLGRWFNWRDALTVVRPKTFVAWHRKGFRLFWRWRSEAGRRPIPAEIQHLIRRMARENPIWGEERIANELLLKLGLRVSPRTIRKYIPKVPAGRGRGNARFCPRRESLRVSRKFRQKFCADCEGLLSNRCSKCGSELGGETIRHRRVAG